jgi:hypothetical protein
MASQREIAKALGRDRSTVREHIERGIYPAGASVEEAVAAYDESIGASREVTLDLNAERTRLTKAQADKTELEAAELAGSLVRVDEVEAEWARMLGSMRSRLLSLPSKAGPRVRVALNDEEAAALIEAEVLEALQELSTDGIPPTTRDRRVRAEARAEGAHPAAEAHGKPVGGPVPAPVRRKRGRAGAVEN